VPRLTPAEATDLAERQKNNEHAGGATPTEAA